jgi:hypothetical protein
MGVSHYPEMLRKFYFKRNKIYDNAGGTSGNVVPGYYVYLVVLVWIHELRDSQMIVHMSFLSKGKLNNFLCMYEHFNTNVTHLRIYWTSYSFMSYMY